jgi:hypothetical protein
MDTPKKDLDNLEEIISMGDDWLRRFGIVAPFAHNTIILNLRVKYAKVKDLEYLIDTEGRKLELTMYFPRSYLFWLTLFNKKDDLMEDVISDMNEYLFQYEITVKLLPYKGGK